VSELHHGNNSELERASAELDEAAARSLGCTALTGHEADGILDPAVAEEQNRDTSAEAPFGLADPGRSEMSSPVAALQERIVRVTATTAIIEVTRPDGRVIRYQVPRWPVVEPERARTA